MYKEPNFNIANPFLVLDVDIKHHCCCCTRVVHVREKM